MQFQPPNLGWGGLRCGRAGSVFWLVGVLAVCVGGVLRLVGLLRVHMCWLLRLHRVLVVDRCGLVWLLGGFAVDMSRLLWLVWLLAFHVCGFCSFLGILVGRVRRCLRLVGVLVNDMRVLSIDVSRLLWYLGVLVVDVSGCMRVFRVLALDVGRFLGLLEVLAVSMCRWMRCLGALAFHLRRLSFVNITPSRVRRLGFAAPSLALTSAVALLVLVAISLTDFNTLSIPLAFEVLLMLCLIVMRHVHVTMVHSDVVVLRPDSQLGQFLSDSNASMTAPHTGYSDLDLDYLSAVMLFIQDQCSDCLFCLENLRLGFIDEFLEGWVCADVFAEGFAATIEGFAELDGWVDKAASIEVDVWLEVQWCFFQGVAGDDQNDLLVRRSFIVGGHYEFVYDKQRLGWFWLMDDIDADG